MIFLLIIHAILSLCGAAALHAVFGKIIAISFLAGAGLMFLNLVTLVVFWPLVLAKKLVALSIGVIVFKFAILAWILKEIVASKTLHLGFFAAGVGLVSVSVFAAGLRYSVLSSSADSTDDKAPESQDNIP